MMKLLLIFFLSLLIHKSIAQNDTVHVVFKKSLDVGFTDLAPKVIEKYMNEYIPKAIRTARSFDKNSDRKFIWTSGSWIISEYLRVSSPEIKAELESAIRDGLICWNAYPFTADNEIMDASLFKGALNISHDLDQQFGKHTIAAKITDVPGETMSVVHILNEKGVRLLHIGNNPASPKADTPPVFLWKDPQGGELVVIYEPIYGGSTQIAGFKHILQFAFTNDNEGPQSADQVQELYKKLEIKFSGAVIKASTLNDYASELWKFRNNLPIVNQEIGNTWIHSAGTDPQKYASFRALMRLRTKWMAEKTVNPDDPKFSQFTTFLLLMAEHTGGIDEKSTIDFDHYTVDELAGVIETPPYQRMVQSWNDSRAYADQAVAALGNSPLAAEAKHELELLNPQWPDLSGYQKFDLQKVLKTKFFSLKFDSQTGAIIMLNDLNTNRMLSNSEPFGLFWHESFSEGDFERFFKQYLTRQEEWAFQDFGKPNVGQHGAVSARNIPHVVESLFRRNKTESIVLLKLIFDEVQPAIYGLPAEVWMEITFPDASKEIKYSLQWFGKKATRLPEAFWFSIGLATPDSDAWKIESIDRLISPLQVVSKGARNLHGFNRGIFYDDGNLKVSVESPDCVLVAPGRASLLDFNNQLPDLSKGWHFNLLNNKWGTNFPTWYSDNAKFRFTIHFDN
jgi:hypothetical protein